MADTTTTSLCVFISCKICLYTYFLVVSLRSDVPPNFRTLISMSIYPRIPYRLCKKRQSVWALILNENRKPSAKQKKQAEATTSLTHFPISMILHANKIRQQKACRSPSSALLFCQIIYHIVTDMILFLQLLTVTAYFNDAVVIRIRDRRPYRILADGNDVSVYFLFLFTAQIGNEAFPLISFCPLFHDFSLPHLYINYAAPLLCTSLHALFYRNKAVEHVDKNGIVYTIPFSYFHLPYHDDLRNMRSLFSINLRYRGCIASSVTYISISSFAIHKTPLFSSGHARRFCCSSPIHKNVMLICLCAFTSFPFRICSFTGNISTDNISLP